MEVREPGLRQRLTEVSITVARMALVVGSLLAYPAALPWLVAFWLLGATVLVARGRHGWPALAACLGIVIVKRFFWPTGVVVFGVVAVLATGLGIGWHVRRREPPPQKAALGIVLVLWLLLGAMAWDWHATSHTTLRPVLQPDRPVVVLGDSLSSWQGSYAVDLEKRLSIPVVNLALPGISSAEGVELLPRLIDARPQLVVLELGGHDFLQGEPREQTERNLERLIEASRSQGAFVILFEIPRGIISDDYAGLDRELAHRYDLELIPDGVIRSLMFWSSVIPPGAWTQGPWLSDDGLHPNAHGNAFLADHVAAVAARVFGDGILEPSR